MLESYFTFVFYAFIVWLIYFWQYFCLILLSGCLIWFIRLLPSFKYFNFTMKFVLVYDYFMLKLIIGSSFYYFSCRSTLMLWTFHTQFWLSFFLYFGLYVRYKLLTRTKVQHVLFCIISTLSVLLKYDLNFLPSYFESLFENFQFYYRPMD